MKKVLAMIACVLCLAMIFPLTACAKENKKKTASPWEECKNVVEAEVSAGFRLNLPSSVGAFDAVSYRAYEGQSIEAVYEAKDYTVTVRKSEGSNLDISGNTTSYPEMNIRFVSGSTVINKGESGVVYQTLVFYDGFSWSLYSPNGYPEDGLDDFITEILGGFNTQITAVYTD